MNRKLGQGGVGGPHPGDPAPTEQRHRVRHHPVESLDKAGDAGTRVQHGAQDGDLHVLAPRIVERRHAVVRGLERRDPVHLVDPGLPG